jgi:glucose-6-phosphate 1-dehydrogenase
VTEVALSFRDVPHLPFPAGMAKGLGPNAMVVRIQPDEGITLRFGAKVPGHSFKVRSATMEFSYGNEFREESPEAYERLLLDALMGDPTLFIRSDEVHQCWRIADPVISSWVNDPTPVPLYEAASWGPTEADRLLERDGRSWRND